MASQDGQEPRDHGAVGCKHEVFLSYSRKQRDFVEQLDKDLRSCGYSPFFDRDQHSLPVTENTTNNICAAIQQCEVGIVVLSEDFFSLTIWPMFELAYMVECKTRIIPVFHGISPADLDDVDKRKKWLLEWEKWADNVKENPDKKKLVRIPEWDKALNSLGPTQGFVYNSTQGAVKLRTEIVKEINSRVSPFLDYSYVQGGARFCQIICEKISNTPVSQAYGKQVVGLYGVGGIGKTTSCKYLCKHYYKELDGRVCHIEFDTAKSEKGRLQEVLKKLMKLSSEVSKDWSEEECHQKLKKGLQSQRIFLAIDNVLDKTQIYGETKRYIGLGAGKSIMLVTARSLEIIKEELKIHDNIAMPELEKHEARALFLKYATPNQEFDNAPCNEVDEKLLNQCIRRCYFSKGKNGSFHYHPLALKVLGSQLESMDYSEWWSHLKDKETFNRFREQQDPVFSILRSSFDDLKDDQYKIMFLDVVLFDTEADYGLDKYDHCNHDDDWDIFKWLSLVHGLCKNEVQNRLRHLEKKSLLEELGDGTTRVGVHDLWREFAAMEANAWENKSQPWLYEIWKSEDQESKLYYGGWKKLQRISIVGDRNSTTSVKSIDFSKCSKVTVLKMMHVNVEENALNLGLLNRLKSLRIECRFDENLVEGMKSLENLKVLSWSITGSLPSTSIITFPTKLQVLRLTCHDREYEHRRHATFETSSARSTLDLGGLRSLQEARIDISSKVHISGLSLEMTKLRTLNLGRCFRLSSLPGVGNIIGMTTLILDNCRSLKMLPNLQMLTKLRRLGIADYKSLTAVPGLRSLVALEDLKLWGCESLCDVSDVSNILTVSRTLNLRGCKSLTTVPGLGSLDALEELDAYGCESLQDLPDVRNLSKLRTLNLGGCLKLTSVPGLGSLVALEELNAWGCEGLRGMPDVSNLTKLRTLNLGGCKSLTTVPGLGSLVALVELKLWGCESLCEVPDVSNLTKLLTLGIADCKLLTTVPGLGSLVAMEELWLWGCESLYELPDVSNLTKLRTLYLGGCKSLTAVPGLRSLVALEELHALGCEHLFKLPDASNVTELRVMH